MTRTLAQHWTLDRSIAFLNHGSFGACPRDVLEAQASWRARMESQPVEILTRQLGRLLAAARAELAAFVGANADDLVFVPNATSGVSSVLRSLSFRPGDELLTTDHGYNACRNALQMAADRDGARVVVARVPFPLASPDETVRAVLGAVSARTRLVLLDHVTSPTGLIFPIESLVADLAVRSIDVLVDGAHAPGMLPLDLDRIGAAYYAGNCHKWLCAPKGSAFLHVRRDRQDRIRPLAISHGANDPRTDASRFQSEFEWTGTIDPTPWLSIPAALQSVGAMVPGGWPSVMSTNRALALEARDILCRRLALPGPAPDAMVGSMAAVQLPLPGSPAGEAEARAAAIGARLLEEWAIEVPIMPWPSPRWVPAPDPSSAAPSTLGFLVRVSAQLYNDRSQFERLAEALARICEAEGSRPAA